MTRENHSGANSLHSERLPSGNFILKWKNSQIFSFFSSQNSELDNEQLDEIEQKAQAKNTKRATEWRVKKFEKWFEKRQITVDLKTVSATDLSEILRKFFAEVKTEKGLALTPSALTGIRAAIHRHLTCAPLSRNKHCARQQIYVCQQNV